MTHFSDEYYDHIASPEHYDPVVLGLVTAEVSGEGEFVDDLSPDIAAAMEVLGNGWHVLQDPGRVEQPMGGYLASDTAKLHEMTSAAIRRIWCPLADDPRGVLASNSDLTEEQLPEAVWKSCLCMGVHSILFGISLYAMDKSEKPASAGLRYDFSCFTHNLRRTLEGERRLLSARDLLLAEAGENKYAVEQLAWMGS